MDASVVRDELTKGLDRVLHHTFILGISDRLEAVLKACRQTVIDDQRFCEAVASRVGPYEAVRPADVHTYRFDGGFLSLIVGARDLASAQGAVLAVTTELQKHPVLADRGGVCAVLTTDAAALGDDVNWKQDPEKE